MENKINTNRTTCEFCKQPIDFNDIRDFLGLALLHPTCYEVVRQRAGHFRELLLLPAPEFREWLENNDQ